MPQSIVVLTPETWDALRALIYDLTFAKSQDQPAQEPAQVMAQIQNDQALFKQVSRGWIETEWPPKPGEGKVTWANR